MDLVGFVIIICFWLIKIFPMYHCVSLNTAHRKYFRVTCVIEHCLFITVCDTLCYIRAIFDKN